MSSLAFSLLGPGLILTLACIFFWLTFQLLGLRTEKTPGGTQIRDIVKDFKKYAGYGFLVGILSTTAGLSIMLFF
jgi:hypothetical protein